MSSDIEVILHHELDHDANGGVDADSINSRIIDEANVSLERNEFLNEKTK